jgi:hypothetical protein
MVARRLRNAVRTAAVTLLATLALLYVISNVPPIERIPSKWTKPVDGVQQLLRTSP